ncbi:hypothetical protein BKI52_40095 [marine bacterium AO1-C]|nr:hypothetical protein BKI52_40095 [marine bacterium AO1-C]
MAHSPYKAPRIFFIVSLSILGILMIISIYFFISIHQVNQQKQSLKKSEQGIRAVGKAYVFLGFYELREFYLVTTDKKDQQKLLNRQIDSLWNKIQTSIKIYKANSILSNPSVDSLALTLAKYRQNSEQIKKLVAQNNNVEALTDLMQGNHRVLLKKLEELFQETIELLPDEAERLLTPEKKAYQFHSTGLGQVAQAFLAISVLTLVLAQIFFEKIYRSLLFRRLIPIIILGNFLMLGVLWKKPVPQYKAKHDLVEDYARFINFMTYFNHYSTLECRHVLDSSRLAKKQLEEEMAVFRRSVRQALRDCKNKLNKRFKKEITSLYDMRAKYFSKIVVPSLVFSFQQDQIKSLYLLLPTSYQPDSLSNLVSPDDISYNPGQNALYTQKFQASFSKVLLGLDQYYPVATKKLYSREKYLNVYITSLCTWIIMLALILWYFHKRKKWIVYKAKEHFLLKKQLN